MLYKVQESIGGLRPIATHSCSCLLNVFYIHDAEALMRADTLVLVRYHGGLMSSGCERLYGWNTVDDRTQPVCLSAHAPHVEAGARERDNGDTIARPVVNYVSLTPVRMHCSEDQDHLEEMLLDGGKDYEEPRPCGKTRGM